MHDIVMSKVTVGFFHQGHIDRGSMHTISLWNQSGKHFGVIVGQPEIANPYRPTLGPKTTASSAFPISPSSIIALPPLNPSSSLVNNLHDGPINVFLSFR